MIHHSRMQVPCKECLVSNFTFFDTCVWVFSVSHISKQLKSCFWEPVAVHPLNPVLPGIESVEVFPLPCCQFLQKLYPQSRKKTLPVWGEHSYMKEGTETGKSLVEVNQAIL